ncbi:MAG: ankyrin repeat domain-containing protein [Candidatus Rokuibacteriota bacterium]
MAEHELATGPQPIVPAEGQARALAQLMAGMDEGGRWVLVLGPEGIGKSTLLRRLLAELELTDADTVVCDGSEALGADGLVALLRSQLQLSPRPAPRSLWGSRPLEDLLANQRARRTPLVVVVDDAHVLSRPSLVLLAELAAKPAATDPAVFVVLAGSPALEQPALRAWGEAKGGRGAVMCRVTPLTAGEVRQYVERRMHAGAGASLALSDVAIQRIVRHTSGVPGLINALCDRVIAHPSSRLGNHVSADTVDEAAEHLGLQASPTRGLWGPVHAEPVDTQDDERAWDRPSSGRTWRRAGLLTGATLVAGLLIYLGPGLLRSSLDWLAVGPEAPPSAPGPEGLGPSRPDGPRRDAAPRSIPPGRGRGSSGAVAPGRHAGEQWVAALDRADKATTAQRAARTPGPVAVSPSPQQVAALLAGARDGQVGDLNRLLTSGVPANVRDANGFTPLMLAVVSGHLPAARALLDGGALVNARNRGGITPVMLAVINEHREVLTLLLERGADVNVQSGTGWTALTFAAWKGDADLVRLLLDHRANPTALDKQRWTPLDYAARKARSRSTPPEGTEVGAAAPADPEGGGHSAAAFPSEPSEAR